MSIFSSRQTKKMHIQRIIRKICIYQGLPVTARKTMMKAEICMKSEAIEVIEFDDANIYLYNE
jgi:hypothetical protein